MAYGIFAAYILAHPVMIVFMALGRACSPHRAVPKSVLIPLILVLCVIGAYALNNIMANVYVLLLFGVMGYLLVKFGFPLAPLILGVILGDQIEVNLVRALMTDANPLLFLTRPISGGMLPCRSSPSSSPSGSTGGSTRASRASRKAAPDF